MATAPAFAVFDLFVGENGLVFWAPPLVGFFLIGETFFVKLEETPLSPFVVIWVGSVNFAVPIDGVAEALGLLAEIIDVDFGYFLRCSASFDGIILGGETKGIIAERAHDIVALLGIEACKDINNSEVTNVANV